MGEEARRRRLPSWMLGGLNSSNNIPCKEETAVAKQSAVIHEKANVNVKGSMKGRVPFLAPCQTKRLKKNPDEQDKESDKKKKKKKKKEKYGIGGEVTESVPVRKQNRKGDDFGGGQPVERRDVVEDEVKLTVEDLLSFAEEYVKAATDEGRQQLSNLECESDSSCKPPRNETNETNIICRTKSREEMTNSNPSTDFSSNTPFTGTGNSGGNSAQSMLDLLLGPLLRNLPDDRSKS